MKQRVIGVIVPVYKAEKYIAECIESILVQTYRDFHLILVDDGTPDDACRICDEYALKDPRITVIHQENAGVTRARARGVEEAADCEFITFVDADDTIKKEYLETLINDIDEETDIVMSYIDDNFRPSKSLVSTEVFVQMLLEDRSMSIAVWGKLYRRNLFTKYILDIPKEIRFSEDIIMNLRIAYSCGKNIKFQEKSLYNYKYHPESIANTFTTTPEYEAKLFQLKMEAIPVKTRQQFIPYTIKRRLLSWRNIWGFKYHCSKMTDCKFYTDLKNDIRTTGYKLDGIERLLFYNTNPIIRFIAINIKKIRTILINTFHIKNR